jgi:hypothetical protein
MVFQKTLIETKNVDPWLMSWNFDYDIGVRIKFWWIFNIQQSIHQNCFEGE